MTKMEIAVENRRAIIDIYDAVAKSEGLNPFDVANYDCREIWVSPQIQDAVIQYYKETFEGDWKEAFSMHWLVYGPKVDTNLSGGEIKYTEKFISLE